MSSVPVPAIKTYVLVWVALLVLLAVTTGSAYAPLGTVNLVVNVGIAAVKALLVATFFMHLKSARAITRLVAGAAFLWLLVLIGLSLGDYLTRG